MQTINLKYNLGDNVLYKKTNLANHPSVFTGTVVDYLVSAPNGKPSIVYYIKTENKIIAATEDLVLNKINNVSSKQVLVGEEAFDYASDIMNTISYNIDVQKIIFDGSKTTLYYIDNKKSKYLQISSHCHPDDKFELKKGVKACLLKLIISSCTEALEKL